MIRDHHRALYASFDVYPSAKGAAIHIYHMARAMFEEFESGLLFSLGNPFLAPYQREGAVDFFRFAAEEPNFLRRTVAFGKQLEATARALPDLRCCHFRDPWSGIPLLRSVPKGCKLVYEVNGLPSIELPFAYPQVGPRTLQKIFLMEEHCIEQADVLVTPSTTLKENLVQRGVPRDKIEVIPNGAEIAAPAPRPADAPGRYLLYFGAVQPWQGVDVLLKAFARLRDLPELTLVVCSSVHQRRCKPLLKLAQKLGVSDRVLWFHQLSREELNPWIQHAEMTVAPLVECTRNLQQGCCPLKILESLAVGTPVVASDLAVVRELMTDGVHGHLVPAGRPDALARRLRICLEFPEQQQKLGENGSELIRRQYTWERARDHMQEVYRALS